MGKGRLRITSELLLGMLRLDGYELLGARVNHMIVGNPELELIIKGSAIPEAKEGEKLPLVMPRYKRTNDPTGEFEKIELDKVEIR